MTLADGGFPQQLSAEALAAAAAEDDPSGLGAAGRLRTRFGAEVATAAINQTVLRRRAVAKFGGRAASMFFTRDGLEQATRPSVAEQHAARLTAAGATSVLDLGCGIGADAMAFVRAGVRVLAVERDPATAELAAANLAAVTAAGGAEAEVIVADAEQVVEELLSRVDAVFCDPARRTGAGRTWRIEDFTPPWSLVCRLLDGSRPAVVKLGPALPHRLIPAGVEAQWISDRGDTVEVLLAAGGGAVPDRRSALITPDRRLVAAEGQPRVRPIGAFVYEPDGAVIRSGGISELAGRIGAGLIDAQVAYLTGDAAVESPFLSCFEVREVLPYKEKLLRSWVREHRTGTLEIKCRGVEVDPAQLRKRLRPSGPESATLIITRTPDGARVLVARRC